MNSSKNQGVERLLRAFQTSSGSLHPQYQEFAPLLLPHIQGHLPDFPKVRLEQARFQWMNHTDALRGRRILELGANTGYFSLRAASELGASSIIYEPDPNLCEIICASAEILGIADRIDVRQEGVVLRGIQTLPSADVLINLNVLHHAGKEFDCDQVQSVGDWCTYATEYLVKLKKTAPLMFFQTGFTWGGASEPLCPPDQPIKLWCDELLAASHWQIVHCGQPKLTSNVWSYSNVDNTASDSMSTFRPKFPWLPEFMRSSLGNLRKIAFPQSHSQNVMALFAKRPIYLCR